MSLRTSLVYLFIPVAALLIGSSAARAQTSTAFSYQGQLLSNGTPLTGPADLRAQLFTAASGGSPVGAAIDLPGVAVTDGLFNVQLDFGNAFGAGQLCWVEISVRSPTGTGSFITLAPRQAITPAPLAHGLAGIPTTRGGTESLDQAQASESSVMFASQPSWQSWTAATTGNLSRVELQLLSNSPRTYTVRVRRGLGTGGALLGEGTASVSPGIPPTSIPLPNIPIQAGSIYTLEFASQFVGVGTVSSQIPGASGFASPGGATNFWFRTFVTAPSFINATASGVPWSGISGVPENVANAFTPWISTGNGISYPQGAVGIGTGTPSARVELSVDAGDGLYVHTANESPWALRIGNDIATTAGFQAGMYVTNTGFFRITSRVANPNGTYAQLGTSGAWTAPSDVRLKTDVSDAEGNLAAAMKLRPVNFRWKSDGVEDFGLIAQEVRAVLPRLVTGDESKDSLTLNYSQLSVVAIGAIQEQQREIERLKGEVARNAAENAELKARLERLEKSLEAKPASR